MTKKWYTALVMKLKHQLISLINRKYSSIIFLLLIVLTLHLTTIGIPSKQVFDEQYYVPAAQSIVHGIGIDRTEHPPLGVLLIASSILIFGDNPLGWRFFSVIFGIISILFIYLIFRQLKIPPKYAFLVAFLLAFENLYFVISSVAMLDVFSLAFMLGSFYFYLKNRYITSGILIGLAALCKLTGVLALPVIALHWLVTDRRNLKPLLTLVIVPATFLMLMPILNLIIWHRWLNPFSTTGTMLDISSKYTFFKYSSEMLSRPWDWILKPEILTFWIDPHYLAMISPNIWALIIPAVGFAVHKSIKNSKAALFAIIWLSGTYLIWIPLSLISDRISYIYYFYPSVGAICIAIGLAASSIDVLSHNNSLNPSLLKLIRAIIPLYVLMHLGAFLILSPVSYCWKLPLCTAAYFLTRYYLADEIPPINQVAPG